MPETLEQTRFDLVRKWDDERRQRGWWHSFELPDGTEVAGVCSVASLKHRIAQFPIPEDLSGKRVLDIGTWDGWFAFEMERRGADVVAIDNWDNPRFHEMRAMLGSRVDYRVMDVYDLAPERVGRFDIVLFMGVLYHLKHPLLALERVCAITTEMAAVDSFVLRDEHRPGEDVERRPVMEFYETTEFGGQIDNWCAPSLACLQAFCRTAGFARVELRAVLENSVCLACYRRWETSDQRDREPVEAIGAFNVSRGGINFLSSRDELVGIWFHWTGADPTLDDVRPEVGQYGVRPVHVELVRDGVFQASFKLPPGLTSGWHEVRVSVGDSRPAPVQRIAVDLPLRVHRIAIDAVQDGTTWSDGQLDLSRGDVIAVWIRGLPANIDSANLAVAIADSRAAVEYISADQGGVRQVNVRVPAAIAAGPAQVVVSVGEAASATADFTVVRTAG